MLLDYLMNPNQRLSRFFNSSSHGASHSAQISFGFAAEYPACVKLDAVPIGNLCLLPHLPVSTRLWLRVPNYGPCKGSVRLRQVYAHADKEGVQRLTLCSGHGNDQLFKATLSGVPVSEDCLVPSQKQDLALLLTLV